MDDIVALLNDAHDQIQVVKTLHDQALEDTAARGPLKSRIKNVLENQRSTLDYLAVAITKRYGSDKGFVYYPLAQSEQEFPSEMETKMPGVAGAEPAICDAIKRHQPFQSNGGWLREMNQLTRQQKHTGLSAQLVRETYQCRVTEKSTGATVQWQGMRFEPGLIDSMAGVISFSNTGDRAVILPQPMEVGKGPFGTAEVFGVPIDPMTQRPLPDLTLEVESGPLHLWCFLKPHKPVVFTLDEIHGWLISAVKDIAQVARL